MKLTKIMAFALALLMLVAAFVACTEPGNGETSTEGAATTTGKTDEGGVVTDISGTPVADGYTVDADGFIMDKVEDTFPGQTLTVYSWEEQKIWEWAQSEDPNGGTVDMAVYNRQKKTEERLQITIEVIYEKGSWDFRNQFINRLNNSVSVKDGEYDIVGQYTPAASIGAMKQLYQDISDLPYTEYNMPWWNSDIAESSSINGKLYFATGAITPTLVRNIECIIANLSLFGDLNDTDNLYDIVNNYEWTMDKYIELAVGKNTMTNVDGTPSYSITINDNVKYDSFFYGAGFKFTDNSGSELKWNAKAEGSTIVDWFDKCQSFLWENQDVELLGIAADNGFTAGNVIFHHGAIADLENHVKDVPFDFALLPYPMLNKDQKAYYSTPGMWVTLFSVPTDAPNLELSGAALEVLASQGYRQLRPVVYEIVFKTQYAGTSANAKMFDLIQDTVVYDAGRVYSDALNVFSMFRDAAKSQDNSWSFKSTDKTLKKNLMNLNSKLG